MGSDLPKSVSSFSRASLARSTSTVFGDGGSGSGGETKSRPTRYWSDGYSAMVSHLQEVKLLEAVHELFNGEEHLVEDLKRTRKLPSLLIS